MSTEERNVALGADHAGFELKETIKELLISLNYHVIDIGTWSSESVDYPDYAFQVGDLVSRGKAEKGILICGTGIGMSIAVNRFPGVRGALCDQTFTAVLSRQHNDSNVLTLGARVTAKELALEIVKIWLETPFSGGRHSRRVNKIDQFKRDLDSCNEK
ncbi:MAG: ribose 5-phosphate isomerase B [Candidatus Tectomicrobia bacterium]|uniref:Ribose 5-phosphate isomerase B n=1 Tax=Tectimicrobiota bacterium TaxID=2528274 RepID=A0A933LPU7_UNCTE|nr:ribose 5-phosphate isomerase B [Candidatus Tectomicrobia bacterium]